MPKAKPKKQSVVTKPKSIKFPENDDEEQEQNIEENGNNIDEEDDYQEFDDQQPIRNDDEDDDAPEEVTFTSSKQLSTQQRQTEKQAKRQAHDAAKKYRATSTGTGFQTSKQMQSIESQIQQAKQVLEQLDELESEEQNNNDQMNLDEEETEYFAEKTKGGRYWKHVGNVDVVALEAQEKGLLPAPDTAQKSNHKSAAELEHMLHEHFYGDRLKRISAVRYAAKGSYAAPEVFATQTF